jgi:hypothetical protein
MMFWRRSTEVCASVLSSGPKQVHVQSLLRVDIVVVNAVRETASFRCVPSFVATQSVMVRPYFIKPTPHH